MTYALESRTCPAARPPLRDPVGPIRFDVAYRIPGLNPTEEEIQAGEDGDPGDIFGAPIGLVLGLGEAF